MSNAPNGIRTRVFGSLQLSLWKAEILPLNYRRVQQREAERYLKVLMVIFKYQLLLEQENETL
tara:strand:+ start:223 stop:411 length:189 start_codon:yes stop_codon:yes gene_type:complete